MDQDHWLAELKSLLAEGPERIQHRLGEMFDRAAGDAKDRIVLCGAGPLGRRTLRGLRNAGIEPLGFLDNNSRLWHTEVEGIHVFPPQEIVAAEGESAVFVVTIFNHSSVRRQLAEMHCRRVVAYPCLYWKFASDFLPYCSLGDNAPIFAEQPAIAEAATLWADELSLAYYRSQLRWRLNLDSARLPPPLAAQDIYFPDDVVPRHDREVFVDCGAFDGDSIRAFLQRRGEAFGDIVALEPDPRNFAKLEEYVRGLNDRLQRRIHCRKLGAASTQGSVTFDAQGDVCSAASASGNVHIECERLDEILTDYPPTFIKMDIEGAELDALEGARNTIARYAPVLAICTYHKTGDLWQIPQTIKSMNDEYSLFLRVYAEDCWESVCYAVPRARFVP